MKHVKEKKSVLWGPHDSIERNIIRAVEAKTQILKFPNFWLKLDLIEQSGQEELWNTIESESESCSVLSNSLWPNGLWSMEFSRPEYWSE